jgi:hypothetical protein
MGLTRKIMSVSTLGAVDMRSDKERIARKTAKGARYQKKTYKLLKDQARSEQVADQPSAVDFDSASFKFTTCAQCGYVSASDHEAVLHEVNVHVGSSATPPAQPATEGKGAKSLKKSLKAVTNQLKPEQSAAWQAQVQAKADAKARSNGVEVPVPGATAGSATVAPASAAVPQPNEQEAIDSQTTGSGDFVESLVRLTGLRDSGALTEEQFEQAKTRLLGQE